MSIGDWEAISESMEKRGITAKKSQVIAGLCWLLISLVAVACANGQPATVPVLQPSTTRHGQTPTPALVTPTAAPSPPTPAATAERSTSTPTAIPTESVEPPTSFDSPLVGPTGAAQPPDIPVYTYDVVAEYPHDPNAFTQGLVVEDGVLVEGTGLRGLSSLREVDLGTGQVRRMLVLSDTLFGEGVTVLDGRIYQLTWRENVGFVYDRETFDLLQTFTYATEGWGLTHDGELLIMSDGSATLTYRDPQTLEAVRTVQVSAGQQPVTWLNELEYVEGEVWANVWQTDRIARIDPDSGQVVGWIDLTGLLGPEDRSGPVDVLNGIAYDDEADRLFVTGKRWPKLFEITVERP